MRTRLTGAATRFPIYDFNLKLRRVAGYTRLSRRDRVNKNVNRPGRQRRLKCKVSRRSDAGQVRAFSRERFFMNKISEEILKRFN